MKLISYVQRECFTRSNINFGILYKNGEISSLISFSNSDYARNINERNSTSGVVLILNSGAVTWSSENQQISDFVNN